MGVCKMNEMVIRIKFKFLEKELARKNISITQLSYKAEISRSIICRWLNENRNISAKSREKLMKALSEFGFNFEWDDIFEIIDVTIIK
jgi:transcriptional regulator with XRE-family HTH domain